MSINNKDNSDTIEKVKLHVKILKQNHNIVPGLQ